MSTLKLLKGLLYSGFGYFVAMSASHWIGFKRPLLFIYFDVPSTPYQDKIISFCAATYAIVFFQGASDPQHKASTAILALAAAVIGLSGVNFSDDLRSQIGDSSTAPYWIQTGLIAGLLVPLTVLYSKMLREKTQKA